MAATLAGVRTHLGDELQRIWLGFMFGFSQRADLDIFPGDLSLPSLVTTFFVSYLVTACNA